MVVALRTASLRPSAAPAVRRTLPIRASHADAAVSTAPLAVITGANTGIGYETAKALLQKGYRVTLACRDQSKAEAARRRLQDAVPSAAAIDFLHIDLADLASVRGAAASLLDRGEPLSALINNAGVMACPQMETKDGFEYQLGVNHLSHFLLTLLLRPLLEVPGTPTRVVNVASHAHYFGHMHFDDLMLQQAGAYSPWKSYGQAKLANVLFSYELARRLPAGASCTVAALHPGVVNTELARYLMPEKPAWWQQGLMAVAQTFALTPEQGAQTSIHCTAAPDLPGGKYWDSCRPVASSAESYDQAVAARLWERSAELVGL